MNTERLSPANHARLTDEAKERAKALRRAAINAALDVVAGGLSRTWSSLGARASAVWRPRAMRQLEA
jgi:hypothetical protein